MELKDFDDKIKEASGLDEEALGIIDRLHTVVAISNIDLSSLNLVKIETSSTHTRLNATNSAGEYISMLIYSKNSFTSAYHIVVSTNFGYIKFSSDRDETKGFDICITKPCTSDMKYWFRMHTLDGMLTEVICETRYDVRLSSPRTWPYTWSYTTDMAIDEAIGKIGEIWDKPGHIYWELQQKASNEHEESSDKGTHLNKSLGTMSGSGSN